MCQSLTRAGTRERDENSIAVSKIYIIDICISTKVNLKVYRDYICIYIYPYLSTTNVSHLPIENNAQSAKYNPDISLNIINVII